MSISVMNDREIGREGSRRSRRGGAEGTGISKAAVYAAIAVLCVVIDQVYALFGHGVRSASMTFMFLYPLAAAVFYFLLGYRFPKAAVGNYGRLGGNAIGSGIAALTVGSFLVGVLEIAGSSSDYVFLFQVFGWFFIAAGLISTVKAALPRPVEQD